MKLRRTNSLEKFNPDAIISNHDIFTRKVERIDIDGAEEERKVFADDSLFSRKVFGSMEGTAEYSCECGKYQGRIYEDLSCEECGTIVQKIEASVDKVGWIDLEENYIIKYVAYPFLEKFMGRETILNIITAPNKITIDGDIDMSEIEILRNQAPQNKYYHIGIEEFREKYSEVMKYYLDINDSKGLTIYEFLQDRDDVFTNKINVLSVVLRPAMRTADGLKMDQLNNIYINIIKNNNILKSKVELIKIIKDITLANLQAQYFQLCDEVMENIKAKNGLIRNQICGTRINFSARNIISPAKSGYKIDEVVMPYQTFLHLYKYELINILSQIKQISLVQAESVWYQATLEMDEEVYKIMKKMILEEEVSILLNRNPTIGYGSILYLKIAGIKHSYDDLTLSLHNSLLSLLAGDYDGDVLNIVSLKDIEAKEVFEETFSPKTLIIDPNNGKFNSSLNLERDQILGMQTLLV